VNDTQYIFWFIGMALAIAALLSFGTLTMAGVLRRHPGETDDTEHAEVHAHPRHTKDDEHHHWYDRFHHAA
jgi:hypothetical protein